MLETKMEAKDVDFLDACFCKYAITLLGAVPPGLVSSHEV